MISEKIFLRGRQVGLADNSLAPGHYRVTVPITAAVAVQAWEAANYVNGLSQFSRIDNGGDNGAGATEVTYTFGISQPTTWPAGLPQPKTYNGDPMTSPYGEAELFTPDVLAVMVIGAASFWGFVAWAIFHKKKRRNIRK